MRGLHALIINRIFIYDTKFLTFLPVPPKKIAMLLCVGLLWQIAGAISAFSQYPAGSWLKREYP